MVMRFIFLLALLVLFSSAEMVLRYTFDTQSSVGGYFVSHLFSFLSQSPFRLSLH